MGLFLRLEEIVSDFPTGTPRKLISVLQAVLGSLQEHISHSEDPGLLSWVCDLVEGYLSDSLSWLDNAHTAQTPRGLVQFLEAAATKLAPDSKLLVAPSYECNYSIEDLVPWFRELLEPFLDTTEVDRLLATMPPALYLVRFPRIERDNVLNHAVFGHEFGHLIAAQFLSDFTSSKKYKMQVKGVTKSLRKLANERASDATDLMAVQRQLFKECSTFYRRGLEELVSDAVGVYSFGPSALFAFLDVFLATPLDTLPRHPGYYPPARYRLRLMNSLLLKERQLQCLTKLTRSFGDRRVGRSLSSILGHLDLLASKRSDRKAIKAEPVIGIAYGWLEETIADALRFARKKCKATMFYENALIEKEIPELLQRLSIEIPPGERGRWPNAIPVDWRSSILSAWIMKITIATRSRTSTRVLGKNVNELHRLALKGIEYSILSSKYKRFSIASRAKP
ncbi:MAG: hypothetical protein ACREVR_21060 [Burkholderiales bacterium]